MTCCGARIVPVLHAAVLAILKRAVHSQGWPIDCFARNGRQCATITSAQYVVGDRCALCVLGAALGYAPTNRGNARVIAKEIDRVE